MSFSAEGNYVNIDLEGCTAPFRVLHVSDSHITSLDSRDSVNMIYSRRMSKAYKSAYDTEGNYLSWENAFSLVMEKAVKDSVDLIALTGDIINFPSEKAVEFVMEELKKTGIPFIFVPGNHDWHLEGYPGQLECIKKEWCRSVLSPLFQGQSYDFSSVVINGVNIIALDNSTYQISDLQLQKFENELKKGMPVMILMHIPVYFQTSGKMVMGNPEWGWKSDRNYQLERRERWSVEGNRQSTYRFIELMKSYKHGVIILCGHTHKEEIDVDANILQIVSPLSRNAKAKTITIK